METTNRKNINTQDSPFDYEVGINLTAQSLGYAAGELQVETGHFNHLGTVHGGCIFTFLDCVGGTAAITYGTVTTASANTHFFRPVSEPQTIRAEATTVKSGKSLLILDVVAYDKDDRMIAKSTITYFVLEAKL